MRRPRDPRSRKKQRPVAIIAAAALIVVVSVPYVALHLPQQRTHRTEATPIIPDELHDQPFAIYDAFAAAPPISRSKFLTHLERLKNRAADDAKWQRSVAATAIDADEVAVQEYVDPMDELEISRESLLETAKRAEMVQEMFREEIMR